MKNLFIKLTMAVGLLSVGFVINNHVTKVQAAAQTQNADFEVQPVLPDAQVDTSLNYFDLKLAPKTTEKLRMRVQNFTDHKITVHSDLRNAMTQIGGGINFTAKTTDLDASLKVPFTTIATLKKSNRVIHLNPNEVKIIEITVKMPAEDQKGMIYGDWHFIEYLQKKGHTASAVSSNYAYSVGVALRGSHYQVYPELKYVDTKPILYNRHSAMGIQLRNIEPMVISKVSAKAVISKEGLFASKHTYQITNTNIAPNSKITLPISWAYDNLEPGKYEVAVKVTGENHFNRLPMSWTYKKSFKITNKDVATINQQAIKKPVNKWAYIATASGLLWLVATAALIRFLRMSA